jgi:hypothetical protein
VGTRRCRAALTPDATLRLRRAAQGKTKQVVKKGHESKEGGFHIDFKEILDLCACARRAAARILQRARGLGLCMPHRRTPQPQPTRSPPQRAPHAARTHARRWRRRTAAADAWWRLRPADASASRVAPLVRSLK